MKNLIFIISLCFTNFMQAQDITGQWNGAIDIRGTSLTIIFNIEEDGEGFTSTMDSPDQGAKGIKTTSTQYADQKLTITADLLGIKFDAELSNDGSQLNGTFNQGPMSLPLVMTQSKMEKKKKDLRPQDPVDFPYEREDVKFHNEIDNIDLAGTLTYPSEGNFEKVVILISGSGPQNRDEELAPFNHRPFLVLSDYLTRQGIAVLRYDDRGVHESEGTQAGATSMDFAGDVESAVSYIKSRIDLNEKQLGLIGHSEGGIIASIVASRNDEVDFITLLAGPGTTSDQLLLDQGQLIGKAEGAPQEVLDANYKITSKAYSHILDNDALGKDDLKKDLTQIFHDNLNIFPEGMIESIGDKDAFVNGQVSAMIDDWFLYFLKCNPADYLTKVTCPVLAINGGLDLQVPADDNLEAIQNALTQGGNDNVTIKKFENQNHLFQTAKTGSPSEYKEIEETMNETTMSYISEWISNRSK